MWSVCATSCRNCKPPPSGCRRLLRQCRHALAAPPPVQLVEQQVDDRRGVEGQHLRHDQAADDGDAERAAQLRARARRRSPAARRPAARRTSSSGSAGSARARPPGWRARATGRAARSASSAKSTSMMPFFLTMPISRMMPMKAITDSSMPASLQRDQRAEAGRGQGRDDGERVRQALVEHAQHDVDREQRRDDQQRPACWPAGRRPWRRRRPRRGSNPASGARRSPGGSRPAPRPASCRRSGRS